MAAPEGNKNAEKWTLEEADKLFDTALKISKDQTTYLISGKDIDGYKYHFLGEVATSDEIDEYSDLFTYLVEKFPELKHKYNKLKGKLEANCFSDSKRGIIKEATAIVNLKSNYNWTDRQQQDINHSGKIDVSKVTVNVVKSDNGSTDKHNN